MITDKTGGLPRFCHPYHGGWDVARIALDIPESRILFVCPVSCARIICLNSIKYGYNDRIDVLALSEEDIVSGSYEEKTVEAACEVLEHLDPKPKALILYVSCIDAMLGNDHSFQTEEVMTRYPDVNCFVLKMCPIARFSGDLPMVALQHDMYAALPEEKVPQEKVVSFIGTNIAFDPACEIVQMLENSGYKALHIQATDNYEDFLKVRASALNLCMMPFGLTAAKMLEERYGTPYLPYFAKYDFGEIRKTMTQVAEKLGIPVPDLDAMEAETRRVLRECADHIGSCELVIDSTAALFPDILRSTLQECGFHVKGVYADDIERKAPDTDSGFIGMPMKRKYEADTDVIALGLVASSFEGASRTIKVFYDNGEWGYYGLRKLAERIRAAYDHPVTAAEIRKGEVR